MTHTMPLQTSKRHYFVESCLAAWAGRWVISIFVDSVWITSPLAPRLLPRERERNYRFHSFFRCRSRLHERERKKIQKRNMFFIAQRENRLPLGSCGATDGWVEEEDQTDSIISLARATRPNEAARARARSPPQGQHDHGLDLCAEFDG